MAANVIQFRPSEPTEDTDEQLVGRAQAGDRAAQELLFRRHVGVVYSLAFKLVGPTESRDVAQDAFVEAFKALGSLRDGAAFRSWLCGITLRLSHRRYRRRRLFGRWFDEQPDESNPVELLDREVPPDLAIELKQVYAIINRFPPKLRDVFILHRLEGMTNEETAAAMGASLSSVKRWLVRAEQRLENAKGRGAI